MPQKTNGDEIVVTGRRAVRSRTDWTITITYGWWQGAPYPVGPDIGSFTYHVPLDPIDRAQQCWADRGSLSLSSINVGTTLKAGGRGAMSGAAKGAARAGAVGWLGGATEIPAVGAGAALGGAKGFLSGAAKAAIAQLCGGK